MPYLLSDDLSCCEVDGHMVFLDIAQDRYFRLADDLESSVRALLSTGTIADEQLKELAAREVLIDEWNSAKYLSMADLPRPIQSAIEQPAETGSSSLTAAIIIEVMLTLWLTRRQLRCRALKAVLEDAISYRSNAVPHAVDSNASLDRLLLAAAQFTRARRYVPIEPRCLLDSLSLLRFLSKRGLAANIVFGVAMAPFAAHCWVQTAGIVLNETLSDANTHTPIRMI